MGDGLRDRYRYALATTLHRSRVLSFLWAIGWVKNGRFNDPEAEREEIKLTLRVLDARRKR